MLVDFSRNVRQKYIVIHKPGIQYVHMLDIDSFVSNCFKYSQVHLEHNHDPRGEVSRADDIKLPTSVVDERPSLAHSDGVHPAEPAVRPGQDRKVSDQRRVYPNMMSKSKENVGTILRSVSLDEARTIQENIDEYVSILLKKPDGGDGPKNPARPPQKGRPEKKDSRGKPLADRGDVRSEKNDSSVKAGNPEGRDGSTRREKRFKDCIGAGSRKRRKRTSSGGD